MRRPDIVINMNIPCKRCGEGGAMESGYCLTCLADFITNARKWPPLTRRKKP